MRKKSPAPPDAICLSDKPSAGQLNASAVTPLLVGDGCRLAGAGEGGTRLCAAVKKDLTAPVRFRGRLATAFLLCLGIVGLLSTACSGDSPAQPLYKSPGLPAATLAFEVKTVGYGTDPNQYGDLRLPQGAGPFPVVVLIHGGYWRAGFGLDLMDGLANDLTRRGYATWNIEYRRVGQKGGGYPGTLEDVAAAVDFLTELAKSHPLDAKRVAIVGHSAGGHLAAWAAGRARLPAGAPGANPGVTPLVTVPLAGVLDLVAAYALNSGNGAAAEFMRASPEDEPGRYMNASPMSLLPTGSSLIIVHGALDAVVPRTQSDSYYAAATAAGDKADLLVIDGADHFDVIDPASYAWNRVAQRLEALLPPR